MESGIDASRRGPMPARTFELTPPRYIALPPLREKGRGKRGMLQRLSFHHRPLTPSSRRPLTPCADLPKAPGATPMICLSLTSLAPSDKDGNVVLKLAPGSDYATAPATRGRARALMCPRRGFILRAVWLPGNRKLWPAFVAAIGIFGRYTCISARRDRTLEIDAGDVAIRGSSAFLAVIYIFTIPSAEVTAAPY